MKRKVWIKCVERGRANFCPGSEATICSNHFKDAKPTTRNPFPTLYLTLLDMRKAHDPDHTAVMKRNSHMKRYAVNDADHQSVAEKKVVADGDDALAPIEHISMKFEFLTREADVRFHTGFHASETFKAIFHHVAPKAHVMLYWEGPKNSNLDAAKEGYKERINTILLGSDLPKMIPPINRKGPARKLSLEQEFLMTMMRLRLGFLHEDLAWRFCVSSSRVTQIIVTWIKLLSKELSCLIIWPSKGQIHATMPDSFKRLYPKTRVIIDCTEIFVETPSSLEVQALLWSEYKHHTTFKVLVCITPNGAISWISPAYGGRSSDKFIVADSGFLDLLEPFDCVMTDRGFKIKELLLMKRCTLSIPPTTAKGNQMTEQYIKETKRIANVRIYVEQAIKRSKDFNILNVCLPLTELPLFNDYMICCCALVNLLKPLCE
eukprot:Seg444.8 transcript_id=Seg444.8/GoldUCD/mRNA.D3Y31 product="hypothetical protein" protein_id=Seg444.8/GoldUCD/D3Y31